METYPGEAVVKEKKFPNSRKPSHQRVSGEFWDLRGQHDREGKSKQTNKQTNPQNTHLTAIASEEVAQMLPPPPGAGQGGSGSIIGA